MKHYQQINTITSLNRLSYLVVINYESYIYYHSFSPVHLVSVSVVPRD